MTTPIPDIPAFAGVFPSGVEEDWRALVDKVLKGGKFDRLIGRTYDGIEIQPLYPRASAAGPRALGLQPGRWNTLTRIDHPDAAAANAQAKLDVGNGADGLHLVLAGSAGAHGFGLTDGSLKAALEGIDPATTAFELDTGAEAMAAAETLADIVIASGLNPSSARISFGLDPVGASAMNDIAASDLKAFSHNIGSLARRGFAGPFCVADGRIVHSAGGSEAQEIAFILSTAVAYLRALEASGIALDKARNMIAFRVAADADEFLTIAKLRALRRLWMQVEDACGLAAKPIHIHAQTAWRMLSRCDPWVNLLRNTVAVFSAAVAGADSISVLPFTQALGLPDAFARRLARNTQLILQDEANIAKAADPAAGAGGFERLSEELSQTAWALFQTLENAGGTGSSEALRLLAGLVGEVRNTRLRNIAVRRDPLTGVSEFPDISGKPVDVLQSLALEETPSGNSGFAPVRNAIAFEHLRARAQRQSSPPRVFLANLGPIAAFNARATFAKNLFEAGGMAAIGDDGFADAAAIASAFAASGAKIACICSSDALYAEHAQDCAVALKSAGARFIYLAGRPGETEQDLRAAGIGGFAFMGCDAVALLEEALTHAN